MAKYVAVKDFPPNIKQGDEVEFKDEIHENLVPYFQPISGAVSKQADETDDTIVTNPDREKLKARATELGITFASNIPTARLMELIEEKEAELADNSEDEDESSESGEE